MSRISKISLLLSGISFVCLMLGRMVLEGWHHVLWVPLLLFLGLGAVPFIKDSRTLGQFLTMKTTKQGFNMGTVIVLVITALVIVNVIASRHYKTWDWSSAKSNTLSEQSLTLLKGLDSDLKVMFFYKKGQEGTEENRRAFRELIKKYQDNTDRLKLEFIEVNERPDLAAEYGVTKGSGLVFLEYKGRKNRIEKIDEQEITSALVKVTREKDRTLYFVEGHGELDLEDAKDALGANALKQLFTNNRYQVKSIPLATSAKIPDDADAVVVLGPKQNFMEQEITALEEYLKRGGSLWLNLESKHTAGLEKLLAKLGIAPMNNYVYNVVETYLGKGINPGGTMATSFSIDSPITKVFGKNQIVIFQHPMGFTTKGDVPGVTIDEIVRSPEGSMAFTEPGVKGKSESGTYTLGVTAKGRFPGTDEKAKEFSLAVFGDDQFLGNGLLYQNLNRDLALNTAATLVREENLVTITAKEVGITQMTLGDEGFRFYILGFIIPIPIMMLAASIGLWMRRRFA